MNDGKNNLSLGNLFNIIKQNSKVKESSVQQELFCSVFNISDINKTTVNNYLIGYRAIGLDYKKIYIELKEKYKIDKNVFIKIFCNLLCILEEKVYKVDDINIEIINNNLKLRSVCNSLITLSKSDVSVSNCFTDTVIGLYNDDNLYECFIEFLFYTILEKKQPVFIQDIDKNIIKYELDEYLKINLFEGISYITSLIELGKKDNMYANAELGSLEYSGLISGSVNYENSYKYYLSSAKKNHPKSCWMVANLILMNKVEEKSIDIMWEYLNKAYKLGSIAAINTIGKCYMSGVNPKKVVDVDKALEYFKKASENGYSYAYNNLGLYYESIGNEELALKYFKLSADLYNSWALNKVGEILRNKGNLEMAYFYYLKSIESPLSERNYYGYYNLAKYYYLVGNEELNIKKDLNKAKEFLKIAYEHGIKEAVVQMNN